MNKIDEIYTEYPLNRERIAVNKKRIARLMQIMGIQAIYPKKNLSKNSIPHPVYPYLLNKINIIRPNQVWGTDITYIKAAKIWFYLVAIMDWFSRYVLAWKLSSSLSGDFCTATLSQALETDIPDFYGKIMADCKIRGSLSKRLPVIYRSGKIPKSIFQNLQP